jgi:hypothetical protein
MNQMRHLKKMQISMHDFFNAKGFFHSADEATRFTKAKRGSIKILSLTY